MTDRQNALEKKRAELQRIFDEAEKKLQEIHERKMDIVRRLRDEIDRRSLELVRQEVTE